jgi:hypothetical protein
LQPIEKHCKKCNQFTKHRWSKDSRNRAGGLYLCAVCSEARSVRHRRNHWLRYLAQKANARHRFGSEVMTEEILQELWDRQNGRCFITDHPFEDKGDWAASLDRINANKGYARGNIILSAWVVNHVRGDLDFDKFAQVCSMVVNGITVRSLLG